MTNRERDGFGVAAEEFAAWLEQAGRAGQEQGADAQEARLLLNLMDGSFSILGFPEASDPDGTGRPLVGVGEGT